MSNISVIMPHYNNALDVKRAYDSILNQSLLPAEIIIIDDCSFDKSILLEMEVNHSNLDVDLKVIYLKKNGGPSIARNVGVNCAKGKYIAFLDSDDVWSPNKLKIQYSIMLEKGLDFTFHLYSAYSKKELINSELKTKTLFSLAKKQIICTPTVMVKKDKLKDFNKNMKYCEDFLCWVMSNNDSKFYYINCVLSNGFKNQYGDSGLSSNMYEMHLGVLNAYKILYKENYINFNEFYLFTIIEYVKYPLRIFKSKYSRKRRI